MPQQTRNIKHIKRLKKHQWKKSCVTAGTVVPAVVRANSQSNGKGQISTPWSSETPERISMKLGLYNNVVRMTTCANACGTATTWAV